MRDLRVRFGFVLAMALLPLLIFTIWRSFDDYHHEQKTRSAIVEDAAFRTVAEVINRLDTTKAILNTTAQTVTPENCDTELKRINNNFPNISNMALTDGQGKPICSVKPLRREALIQSALISITAKNRFNIELHDLGTETDGPRSIVSTSLGVFEDNKLKYMFRAGSDFQKLSSLATKSELLDDIHVSIFSRSGDFIIGDDDLSSDTIESWATEVINNGRYSTSYINALGQDRNVTIIPTREAELFVALNAPRATLMNINKIHPISSALIPLLAWAFAFMAIWIATNKLLISHLQPMTRAANKFANGKYKTRIGKLKDAPAQIQELAGTLDVMAQRINERDKELTESLTEKETLLREIHHRVKNNLQIIISLLNMQNRQLKDPAYTEAITETRNRINAIALVHKALYESDDIQEVEMQPFLSQLIAQVSRALLVDKKNIFVDVNINCIPRDADRATTIAMFIVEAMTNSVKHGVPNGGHIQVNVEDKLDETIVSVQDNGQHDHLASEVTTKKGTGERLMKGFARQLSGQYSGAMSSDGYKASLIFPKTL